VTAAQDVQALNELPGSESPPAAAVRDGGTNFAVAATDADAMLLCLFDADDETQIPLTGYDAGIWHGFLPGIGAGQAYGYRAAGRYDPASAWFEVCHGWAGWRPRSWSWWITLANLIGSVAFGVSAVAGYINPATGQVHNAAPRPESGLALLHGPACR
jgi:hypothetical protein